MGKKAKERFVIWIHCKPYVRRYLLQNFKVHDSRWPELVDVRSDRELAAFINGRLMKPSHRFDKRNESRQYPSRVAVEISRDQFYRYGWALSASDERLLCRALELRCETLAKTFLSATYLYSGNLAECIRLFRRTFGFTEDDWQVDALRKMWLRDRRISKQCVKNENFVKNTLFVLEQLSHYGTIAQKGKELYENNLLQHR